MLRDLASPKLVDKYEGHSRNSSDKFDSRINPAHQPVNPTKPAWKHMKRVWRVYTTFRRKKSTSISRKCLI